MIRILLADDHDLVLTGLSRMLIDEGFEIVAQASSGEEAIALCKRLSPDVVMMDVKMPGIGGVEATKRICLAHDKVKVIAVTSCEDDLYPSKLLQAGACAYLSKRAKLEEMVEAINSVVAGKTYISQEIAQQLALKSSMGHKGETPFHTLSDREMQVATMTMQGKKPAEIASVLNVTAKTVNSFRYRIFEKFDINTDVELLRLAIKYKMFDLDLLE